MKTLRNYLVVSILLLSRTVSADHNHNSTLLLHHQDYVPMIIELNYMRHHLPQTEFTFNNLTPGRHYLRIFGINGAYNMHGEPVFFKGYVDIPEASMVTIVLLNNRTLHYASILPKPIYAPISSCSTEPYYSAPVYHCPAGIDPRRYESIRASIAARSFDKTRLDLAKQAIRNNNMSSEQIAGLAELLTFDSSRLALAKFGYRYVADPENYHVLYELFAFDSSVRQLSDYIARMS
jgi:hypothetical protein